VAGLNSFYGRAHILHDVSLEAAEGEVVVLLGRNGAGKSTTLKSIMGLVRPASGSVEYKGKPIHRCPPYKIARMGLGYIPEDRRIFPDLTVRENLEVGRRRRRKSRGTADRVFELFPKLAAMQDRLGGHMSGGEQQMLTIARTLMGNPEAILMDEPSEGLAPIVVEQMAAVIRSLKAEGLTILLSEQNLEFALSVSDRAYVLERGRVEHAATTAEISGDHIIRAAYLAV
jgi:branched-chain amino acid transport system ATP-binding protein